jgi:DNA-damage-inducible protein D
MSNIEKHSNSELTFEDFKNENGLTYWWASDLMQMLDYPNMKSFQKVLDRATKAFVSLNIPHYENIIAISRTIDGDNIQDFKLTRFACYIAVMNGDPKKEKVAQAQSYFAQQTRKFELYIQNNNEIDRLLIREELTEGNKSLSSIAKQSGVEDFAKFQNAGYLGMYNMKSWQLENKRKVKKGKLMDNMGRTELAANLFRITQTEERIKNKNIQGQENLEQTHYEVGKEVRKIVKENVGKNPEDLPMEKQLPEVKKELKQGYRKMLKQDSIKKSNNNIVFLMSGRWFFNYYSRNQ